MSSDPPSITAVAELAGVSIATVSRVLNNSKPVNAATREKVEAAVAQLGYRANAIGRILRKAESRMLLVMVPDFANPYYAEIVQGVEAVTKQRGYHILLADAPKDWSTGATALEALHNRLADGVICLAHLDPNAALQQTLRELPWVACSEFMPDSDIPHVSIDHRQAAIDAVQYLINRGHRSIALISAQEDYLWAQQRREGYLTALQRAGLRVDPRLMQTMPTTSYADGAQAMGTLLTAESLPSAVFAVSDTLAIGAIKALRRAGRRVPDDVAVIGFDNLPLSDVFEPGLTTIAQPMRQLGAVATELLLDRLAGRPTASRTLSHTLIIRESA